jgi:hypothetical protein
MMEYMKNKSISRRPTDARAGKVTIKVLKITLISFAF